MFGWNLKGREKMVGPGSFLSGPKNQSPQIGENEEENGEPEVWMKLPSTFKFLLTLICLFPLCFFLFSDLTIHF